MWVSDELAENGLGACRGELCCWACFQIIRCVVQDEEMDGVGCLWNSRRGT